MALARFAANWKGGSGEPTTMALVVRRMCRCVDEDGDLEFFFWR